VDRPAGAITGTVTAYGTTGPLAARSDDPESLVAARYGLATAQPGWQPGPVHLRLPYISVNAGALLVIGVLAAALGERRRATVETSLLSGLLATTTESFVAGPGIDITGRLERLLTRRAAGVQPFYGAYECADGRWLHLGSSHPHFIARAAEALGIGADAQDPFGAVEERMRTRPAAEWAAIFEAADVPYAPVLRPDEALDDPQVRLNGPDAMRFAAGAGADGGRAAIPTSPDGPLAGIRVLELGNLIAAPLAGRVLADLGADVIKLEPPDGGDLVRRGDVPAFHPLNAGKRGITADLKSPAGRAIADALLPTVDVLLANMRPGALERLGLGPAELVQRYPGLVVAAVSAFGSSGPYALRAGVDGLAGAIAGAQLVQGGPEGRPVQLTAAPHDHTTGLLAAAGILMALVGRARSGAGAVAETSLLDAARLQVAPWLTDMDETGGNQYGPSRWERMYETADGWIAVAAAPGAQRDAMAAITGRSHAAAELAFRRDGAAEWLARFDAAGVPAAPVTERFWERFEADSQLEALDAIAAPGPVRFTQRWIRTSLGDAVARGTAPGLGEHNRDVTPQ
jgi:crotonobetainyl-CoA:carnitine CoA-transferase CaiB-like acyl-CoA transferase